jgi:hypothetical protein
MSIPLWLPLKMQNFIGKITTADDAKTFSFATTKETGITL